MIYMEIAREREELRPKVVAVVVVAREYHPVARLDLCKPKKVTKEEKRTALAFSLLI
jgi:hypothetical protein